MARSSRRHPQRASSDVGRASCLSEYRSYWCGEDRQIRRVSVTSATDMLTEAMALVARGVLECGTFFFISDDEDLIMPS